ncbi:MAG: nitrite/sulfite reductase [Geobacteraceae bacterium]|nr:nitrite/sulfite reductase [Geobacteraceae bacterium]
MSIDPQKVRIEGIYQQRQDGCFMQRVKLPAGVVSSGQAGCIASVAERFGRGTIHLTSRGSMEIHWLKGEDLHLVKQELAKFGLTSRGACGGAVRGISCSSQDAARFPQLESLAREIHRNFTGNPRFEGLPKKFKIGIEADTVSGRHLIQDVGLVLAGDDDGVALYDIWIAGGLGREPQAGFLLEKAVPEMRIIPIIEAVVKVYARLAPPPKRVKFLATKFGEAELTRLVQGEPCYSEELPDRGGFKDNMTPAAEGRERLILPLFAGQLTAAELGKLALFADKNSAGLLQTTADQNIAFPLSADVDAKKAADELATFGEATSGAAARVTFRICPGNHECKMGLTATRDVAKTLIAAMPEEARGLVWALSGCGNSCTQPQLADVGIVSAKLVSEEDGGKTPRFDLYRRKGAGFGEKICNELTIDELIEKIRST